MATNETPTQRRRRRERVGAHDFDWVTFKELTRLLDVPAHYDRTLERRILGSPWQDRLMVERLTERHGRQLPRPGRADVPYERRPSAWVMSRELVRLHRAELRAYLFGARTS